MISVRLESGDCATIDRHWKSAGRIRLRAETLRARPSATARIEAAVAALPGVVRAYADPDSGRVLVEVVAGLDPVHAWSAFPAAGRSGEEEVWFGRSPWRGWFAGTRRPVEAAPSGAWHALTIGEAASLLDAPLDGLTAAEAARRRRRFGPNIVDGPASRSDLAILAAQLDNLPSAMLLASSAVSLMLGNRADAASILTVVGLNSAVGYGIEHKNEQLLASWRKLEAGLARALRGGELQRVPVGDLVPGDVILCRAGDVVPADVRVIDAHRLTCNEAMLTGESEPQWKQAAPVPEDAPVAERRSMMFAGTTIVRGHGRGLVVGTGASTEMARIAGLLEAETAPVTPIERRYGELANRLTIAGAASGAASAVLGLFGARGVVASLRDGVALAVAAIPEALPVVATSALVRAMARLRERGLVVRRLASAETLGAVTVLCADKTGTLTRNDMHLERLEVDGRSVDLAKWRVDRERIFDDRRALALLTAMLNSDVDVLDEPTRNTVSGSSTERALVQAAADAGLRLAEMRSEFPRLQLRERSAGVHYATSLHRSADGRVRFALVKGAPEQVLALCCSEGGRRLTGARKRRLLERNAAMAEDGMRVLALAWRRVDGSAEAVPDGDFEFLGLAGLRDPMRIGAAEAVRSAARAGVRTVIVTGDQRRTAQAVARAIGLVGETIDGAEVRALVETGQIERLRRAAAFSRVSPAEKVAIVEALQRGGEIVAMVGDGVNDAPALKAADIGVAVGVRSSDLARQAADLVMENEDLRAVLSAISEGRIVHDNLRRALRYLLTTNVGETLFVLGAALAGRSVFTPLQLLWLNLLTDTLPALALAFEPGDTAILDRPPARRDAPLVDADDRAGILRDGVALAAFGALSMFLGGPSLAFAAMGGAEVAYSAACRAPGGADEDSAFARWLVSSAALHATTLVASPVRRALGLPAAVSAGEWIGFSGGLLAPWIWKELTGGDEIVRRPSKEAPQGAEAAASDEDAVLFEEAS